MPDRDDPDDEVGRRAAVEFGLDDTQAARLRTVLDAVDPVPTDLTPVVDALADDVVAEAAWTWWGDADLLGEPLDALVGHLAEQTGARASHADAIVWLRARHLAHSGATVDAIELLESARDRGHRLVLTELAAFEADRSEPVAAQRLLERAGVPVGVDLDAEYDPRSSDAGFGRELAEEVAPFAAMRPRPMVGRNERCPCGSGRKYKQCHLGSDLHPLADRAGWLFVKLLRFMQVNAPNRSAAIADDIVESVADDDLRAMMHESYLPIDLALFEGGVADWFLRAKAEVLPPDEVGLLRAWIDQRRSVFEVVASRPGSMDLVDVASRARRTVIDTVPDEPLAVGWTIMGRLVPVGDTYRAFGGFLPVDDDSADAMLAACATGELDVVVATIGQLFETAASHDEISELFADAIDTTELTELLGGLGDPADDA